MNHQLTALLVVAVLGLLTLFGILVAVVRLTDLSTEDIVAWIPIAGIPSALRILDGKGIAWSFLNGGLHGASISIAMGLVRLLSTP